MNFPLEFSFKILAIASQIFVRDASGSPIAYVKQKLFKLREDIDIYADESRTQLQYNIKADRVIDFSARYTFTDRNGSVLGAVKREGMRSIWKARYQVFDASGAQVMKISEEDPWAKIADALFSEIPIFGFFTGYLFHPKYLITRLDEREVARLEKLPAFFESKFRLSSLGNISADEEQLVLLSFLMMALLERGRG
jgi:uncharacterized protein YxjI